MTPIAGYLSAIRSIVVSPAPGRPGTGARRARGAGLDRRPRGPPLAGRRRRARCARWSGRSGSSSRDGALPFWDLLRTKVAAAAVVTASDRTRGRAGCSSWRSPTSRCIDRLRLAARAPGSTCSPARPGAGKSLLIDALGLALGRAGGHVAGPARARRRARVEALFDRVPEPLIARPRGERRGDGRPRGSTTRPCTAGRLAGDHRAPRRDPRPARPAAAARRGLAARPARRVRRPRRRRGRPSRRAVERWRANRAALAELAIDPRELQRRLELLEHEAAEIDGGPASGRARRPSSPAQLAAAQHAETIASGAVDRPRRAAGRGTRRPRAGRGG